MRKIGIYILLTMFITINILLVTTAKKFEPKYTVKNLVITNNHIIPTNVLLEFTNVKDKETLTSLTAEMIIDRILKHPYVKNAEGVFVDSITYVVKIEEVNPFLLIVTDKQNLILTKEKKLIPEDQRLNILDLPVVTLADNQVNIDELKTKFLKIIFESFYNVYQTDIALFEIISELNIDNKSGLTFYLTKPRGKIFVGSELDQLKSIYLSEFWRKVILTNPEIQYDYIDLRYKDQIVVKLLNTKTS